MEIPGLMVGMAGVVLAFAPVNSASAVPQVSLGTISVGAGRDASNAEDASPDVDAAAAAALGEKGFTILNDPGHAAYVAEVVVTRTDVGAAPVRVRSGKAAVVGAGLSVPIGSGGSRIVPLQRTELTITIRKRGGAAILWHGAAMTVRSEGALNASADGVASALSEAALRRYPAVSNEVTSVP